MNAPISRRESLRFLAGAFTALLLPTGCSASESQPPTAGELARVSQIVENFMGRFSVPGFSIAIARHGQMVLQQAFGVIDRATGEKVNPTHLFRIASVTKPITSAGIFKLIEKGHLRLSDFVFGKHGILGSDYGTGFSERVYRITIEHLLTHTCGGWSNERNDPMFLDPSLTIRQVMEETLQNRPLENEPGTHYAYSNFGYAVLGRVIEKLSGQGYPAYTQQEVLSLCDVTGMRIGGNTLAERLPGEVVYHGQGGDDPYAHNIRRMDSHGGWIATPTDLVRFALRMDGFPQPPDIFPPETLRTILTPSRASSLYAKGWCVNTVPDWWHSGSLPGTTTIVVRTATGLCWAGFANTQTPAMNLALDRLMWDIVGAVPSWRAG